MKQKLLLGLIISTLFIEKLWKVAPYSKVTYPMFLPYSDTLITKPTYYWFFGIYTIQLIYIRVWYVLLPQYRLIFNTWFIFQMLEVLEFYLTFNEPHIFFLGLGITVVKLKYVGILISTIIQFRWKTSQSQDGR